MPSAPNVTELLLAWQEGATRLWTSRCRRFNRSCAGSPGGTWRESAAATCSSRRYSSTLETFDRRKRKVIELKFFGRLSLQETADVLQVSVGTIRRDWSLARAWLYRELVDRGRCDSSLDTDSEQ
jgi:DNA-directed RNA polymerase specialized sigma24 family protein